MENNTIPPKRKAWNSGLTKSDPRVQKMYTNRDPWNKGLTKETDNRVKEISLAIKQSWTPENISQRTKSYRKNMMSKYGVVNTFQLQSTKDKLKKTCIKKYGVSSPIKTKAVQDKSKQTKLNLYGDENYNNIDKYRNTMLERYGVTSPVHIDGWFERWTKSGVKRRPYTLPSGKVVMLQGYENKALDLMLKKYTEVEIFEEVPPIIEYVEDGVKRKFHPDFYIKKQNLIIEVKSQYTFDKWISKNTAKMEECKNKGFVIQFWIIGKNGNLEKIL